MTSPASAPPPAALRRRRAPFGPRRLGHPLVAALVLVALAGLAWALVVPPFQAPDEIDHYAYAESLATRFALPSDATRPTVSRAEQAALDVAHAGGLSFFVDAVRPPWRTAEVAPFRAQAAAHPSRDDGGGPNTEGSNPPLFYLIDDLPYLAAGGTAFDRLYAMRAFNVLLLLATTVGAWLLAGEALGRRRPLQLAAALVAGLVPEVTFISTKITPDGLVIALWTLTLWIATRTIRRGARTADVIALFGLIAAAILTKATDYALLPPATVALLLGIARRPRPGRRSALLGSLVALPVLVVPVLAWLLVARGLGRPAVNTIASAPGRAAQPFSVRNFVAYVWQFYLPRLPFMAHIQTVGGRGVIEVWLKEGVGDFGWLDVPLPSLAYDLVAAAIGLIVIGLLAAARALRRPGAALIALYLTAIVSLLALLHITEYRSLLAHDGPLMQGRYILPLIGIAGLAVAVALARLPARWRGEGIAVLLVGLVALQLVGLATVAKVYFT